MVRARTGAQTGDMTQIPRVLRRDLPATSLPDRSLFDLLGALGPAPAATPGRGRAADAAEAAPFRAACVLEVARRNRPAGPPRPTPHGAAPPVS